MPDWLIWLVVAGALAAAETTSGSFVLLMMAGGAAGGAITAAIGGGVALQVIVAIVLTIGLVWLVRPVALRHAYAGPPAITGAEALVGEEAVVLSEVTRDGGRVRLRGAEWSARSRDPSQVITVGSRVAVVAIDGATAVVWQDPFALPDR
jgi:membrane protein implicated in regulation of membrane protease activity